MLSTTFGVWDYLVFGLMVVASIAIGIYHAVRGRNQSTSDYLVAGRSMTWLPVALSLIATYNSSIMMLGTPAESYVYGISWILSELGSATGNVLEMTLALTFTKRLDLSSPYEYFERRFQSRGLRLLTNGLTCINNLMYMGMVLYGQAIALQTVTSSSMYTFILVTAGAAVIYTTLGGLKTVIWTDVLQFLIMFSGFLAVTIKGTLEAGGASQVWGRAAESGRLNFSLDPDPTVRHTVWNLFFGRIITGFGLLFSPLTLQRISSTKSLTHSRRALYLAVLGFLLLSGTALAEGIVAFGYYVHKRCDPLASKQIDTPNQIIPFIMMDLFENLPGMPGLFLAALTSACLSTISSCLTAISGITWYDLVKPFFPNLSDFKGLLVAKVTVVISGVMGCLVAVGISLMGSRTLIQISYTLQSITRFPVIGLFYLGAVFPFVNTRGAVTGFVTGLVFMGWLVFGSMFSASGDSTSYYPLGPTDQCPAFNMTTCSNITSVVPITPEFNTSTSTVVDILLTQGHNTTSDTKSGLDVFYSLSYTLFSTMAVIVVLLVGVLASLLTGGWRNQANPELLIQYRDIQCWSLSQRLRRYSITRSSCEKTAPEQVPMTDSNVQDISPDNNQRPVS